MNWNRGHSPPFQGGVAATPRSGRGGCVSDKNHPGCASQGTGPFLGGAQPTPPWKGGECPRFQFIHSPYNARFKLFRPYGAPAQKEKGGIRAALFSSTLGDFDQF